MGVEGESGRSGPRDAARMEDVLVKQGSLYLQQQQTFGKVGRAPLVWGWAERWWRVGC